MKNLIGNFYSLFNSLFGTDLGYHLWGYDCQTETFIQTNLFFAIGLITTAVVLIFVIAYYYLPLYLFNHSRSNRWWNWLIILLISSTINFLIAALWMRFDYLNGNIQDCLMYVRDENGQIITHLIRKSHYWLFGLTNIFVSISLFIVSSLILKWWSPNCKNSPHSLRFKK